MRTPAIDEALLSTLRTMNLPDHRKTALTPGNLQWLKANLATRNAQHPKYTEAIGLIEGALAPAGV